VEAFAVVEKAVDGVEVLGADEVFAREDEADCFVL